MSLTRVLTLFLMIVLLIALIIFSYASLRNRPGKRSESRAQCPAKTCSPCPTKTCKPCQTKTVPSVTDDTKQIEAVNSVLQRLPADLPSSGSTSVDSGTIGYLPLSTALTEKFDWNDISDTWNNVINIFKNPKEAFKKLLLNCLRDLVTRGDLQNISLSSVPLIPLKGTGYNLRLDTLTIANPKDNYVVNIDVDNLIPSMGLLEITYNNLTFIYVVKLPNVGITTSIVDDNNKVLMSTVLIFDININFVCSSNCTVRFKSETQRNELFGINLSAPEFSLLFTQPSFKVTNSTFKLVSAHTVENNVHPCPTPYASSMGGVVCSQPSDIDAKPCSPNEKGCRSYKHFFTPKSAKPCDSLCTGPDKNTYANKTYATCPWEDESGPLSSGASCKWNNSICPDGFEASANTCIVKDKTEWAKEKILFEALGMTDGDYTKETAVGKLEDYLMRKLDLKQVVANKVEQYITNIDYNKVYSIADNEKLSTKLVYVVSIKITK